MDIKNINYPLARNHQIIQSANIFKPIKKGAREKGVLITHKSIDGSNTIEIAMFEQLDIGDQDVLLALLAMALPTDDKSSYISTTHEDTQKKSLFDALKTDGVLTKWKSLSIKTTIYELLKELGKSDDSRSYQWLKKSLTRLQRTSITIDTKEYCGGSQFLSFAIDKETGELHIGLNPVNALVIVNDKHGYILHNRKQRQSLESDSAKALYSVLVGLVNIGNRGVFKLNTLIEKVYLIDLKNEITKNKYQKMKRNIIEALEKLNNLEEWSIENLENSTYAIKRLKLEQFH